MKRTYIKPTVEILDIETKSTFMADSWNVRGKNTNPETDHGYIIEEGGENPDNYNPWDSSNW